MSHRIKKINSLIISLISEIFSKELSLKPGVFLTVSRVDTTRDLRYSHISVSVFPESESNYAMKTIEKESYLIQRVLNSRLHLKIFPKLKFKLDATQVGADKIERILRDIREEK